MYEFALLTVQNERIPQGILKFITHDITVPEPVVICPPLFEEPTAMLAPEPHPVNTDGDVVGVTKYCGENTFPWPFTENPGLSKAVAVKVAPPRCIPYTCDPMAV